MNTSTRAATAALAAAVALAVAWTSLSSASLSYAETPSPASTPGATPASTPAPSSPSPAPSSPAPSSPAPSPTTTNDPPVRGAAASITLAVTATGGPVAGAFFEDLGSYAFSGVVDGVADGATVTIARRTAGSDFAPVTSTTVSGGRYTVPLPVTDPGSFAFRASAGAGGDGEVAVESNLVAVTVGDATVSLDAPVSKIDSLVNPTLTGSVVPARAGVTVNIDVWRSGKYRTVASTVTDAAGRYRTTYTYGKGKLASYAIRPAYRATNSPRWEKGGSRSLARIAVINAKITDTTADEVAKTYHQGCPVGRSKLKTITMNFYGRDKTMHRGVIIIRSDLTTEVIRGFTSALAHRYPVAKMNNPNAYGGNDPKQMKANNTSGFNCRKVVGNPYRQSPHSYGIALDVNTVQNPYRDARGKWWPSNGKTYINRKNKRSGMLYQDSYLTKSLRKDDFFWGGFWNPGRDYQHFQYTK